MSAARRLLPEAAAVLLLLLAFSARSLTLSQRHVVPVFDEIPYLDEAREHSRLGGPLAIAACYARGECRYDNRNPLFSMLLAPWMTGGPRDFPRAKLAVLLCALALLLTVHLFTRALWDAEVGLLATALLALSPMLAQQSQQVLADVLYAALYCASLGALLLWERAPRGWAACGALAGAAYLAKGSGHFLLLAPAALSVLRFGRRAPLKPGVWISAAAFAAVAGFLLLRNVRVFGDPFYNVNAKGLWLDDWSQVWSPLSGAHGMAELGPLRYLSTHTLSEIAARCWRGALKAFSQLVETAAFGPVTAGSFTGLVFLAAAARGLRAEVRAGRPERALVPLAAALPLFAAYAWASSAGIVGYRFHIATAASLAAAAALGLREAWRRFGPALPPALSRAWAAPAAAAVAALLALAPAAGGLARSPSDLWAVPPHWSVTADWLAAHMGDKGFLLSQQSYFSLWDRPGHDPRQIFSYERPAAEVLAFADARGADLLVLDTRAPSAGLFPERFGRMDEHGPLSYLGWPRCYQDPVVPSQFLVYCRPRKKT
jgi:4-amino-4-deoxy-L-arabinose transferase-like glycosyltransferase